MLPIWRQKFHFQFLISPTESLMFEESDDYFGGTRRITYLCNNLVANKETVENLMGIYVTGVNLVAQYNCLEFKSFGRIWLL